MRKAYQLHGTCVYPADCRCNTNCKNNVEYFGTIYRFADVGDSYLIGFNTYSKQYSFMKFRYSSHDKLY